MKQEYEKRDELKRYAMRATAALLQIPEAGVYFFEYDMYFLFVLKSWCKILLKFQIRTRI